MSRQDGTVLRFSLTSADPAALAGFYREALGFTQGASLRVPGERYGVAGDASVRRLQLGAQEIELVGFDRPGAPYPDASTSHDGWFQHLALVTADLDLAYWRLLAHPGWTPISRGPVTLPASSGGVRAFKFRDPEGHPLELLHVPAAGAPALPGIDHSALVVADLRASLDFYAGLGFTLSGQSENEGTGQDTLDGADQVAVSVRALSRAGAAPHLELLGYHAPLVRPGRAGPADVACTRTVLLGNKTACEDPDGHRIVFDAA